MAAGQRGAWLCALYGCRIQGSVNVPLQVKRSTTVHRSVVQVHGGINLRFAILCLCQSRSCSGAGTAQDPPAAIPFNSMQPQALGVAPDTTCQGCPATSPYTLPLFPIHPSILPLIPLTPFDPLLRSYLRMVLTTLRSLLQPTLALRNIEWARPRRFTEGSDARCGCSCPPPSSTSSAAAWGGS